MLFGRRFKLLTDHKPLLTIFGSHKGIPATTASRLQRWALSLLAYGFSIHYQSITGFGQADVLSRLIADHPADNNETVIASVKVDREINRVILDTAKSLPVSLKSIQQHTSQDAVLRKVMKPVKEGWPSRVSDAELIPYHRCQNSLSIVDSCLLFAERVVVPSALQRPILTQLHKGHQGITRTKALARSYVYWPGMDDDISHLCRRGQKAEREIPDAVKYRPTFCADSDIKQDTFAGVTTPAYNLSAGYTVIVSLPDEGDLRFAELLFADDQGSGDCDLGIRCTSGRCKLQISREGSIMEMNIPHYQAEGLYKPIEYPPKTGRLNLILIVGSFEITRNIVFQPIIILRNSIRVADGALPLDPNRKVFRTCGTRATIERSENTWVKILNWPAYELIGPSVERAKEAYAHLILPCNESFSGIPYSASGQPLPLPVQSNYERRIYFSQTGALCSQECELSRSNILNGKLTLTCATAGDPEPCLKQYYVSIRRDIYELVKWSLNWRYTAFAVQFCGSDYERISEDTPYSIASGEALACLLSRQIQSLSHILVCQLQQSMEDLRHELAPRCRFFSKDDDLVHRYPVNAAKMKLVPVVQRCEPKMEPKELFDSYQRPPNHSIQRLNYHERTCPIGYRRARALDSYMCIRCPQDSYADLDTELTSCQGCPLARPSTYSGGAASSAMCSNDQLNKLRGVSSARKPTKCPASDFYGPDPNWKERIGLAIYCALCKIPMMIGSIVIRIRRRIRKEYMRARKSMQSTRLSTATSTISRKLSNMMRKRYEQNRLPPLTEGQRNLIHLLTKTTIDRIVEAAERELAKKRERERLIVEEQLRRRHEAGEVEVEAREAELAAEAAQREAEAAEQQVKDAKDGRAKTAAQQKANQAMARAEKLRAEATNMRELAVRRLSALKEITPLSQIMEQEKDLPSLTHQDKIAVENASKELRPYLSLPRYHTPEFFLLHPNMQRQAEMRTTIYPAPERDRPQDG
ncbi:unnamed protein product [Dicrocoelium dendriticum]|nr:unnamed protein product [Dicrocoelium dendriticum]